MAGNTENSKSENRSPSPSSDGTTADSEKRGLGEDVREDAKLTETFLLYQSASRMRLKELLTKIASRHPRHVATIFELGNTLLLTNERVQEPVVPAEKHHESDNAEMEEQLQETEQQHPDLGPSDEAQSADHQAEMKVSKELSGPAEDNRQSSTADLEAKIRDLEKQIADMSDMSDTYSQALDDWARNSKEVADQKKEFEREKEELQAKIDQLENGNRGESPPDLDMIRQESAQNLEKLKVSKKLQTKLLWLFARAEDEAKENAEKYQTLRENYEEEKKNDKLTEQLAAKMPMAGGKNEPRAMKRLKEELARRGTQIAELQAENRKMKWEGIQSATEMVQNCSHLADPQAPVFRTMEDVAAYADGVPGSTTPTEEQLNDIRNFKEYLGGRAAALETAMSAPTPGVVLGKFDFKWNDKFCGDVVCRLHEAVVNAASLTNSAKSPDVYTKAMEEMEQIAKEVEVVFDSPSFPGCELVAQIRDRADELRKKAGRGGLAC